VEEDNRDHSHLLNHREGSRANAFANGDVNFTSGYNISLLGRRMKNRFVDSGYAKCALSVAFSLFDRI